MDGGTIPPRHESRTKFSVSNLLAAIGPKADFGACHYPLRANPPPFTGRPGSDRRQARRATPEPSSTQLRAWRIAQATSFAPVRASRNGAPPSRHRRVVTLASSRMGTLNRLPGLARRDDLRAGRCRTMRPSTVRDRSTGLTPKFAGAGQRVRAHGLDDRAPLGLRLLGGDARRGGARRRGRARGP